MEFFRHPKLTGPGTFEEEPAQGVFLAPASDDLALLDMPSGLDRGRAPSLDALERASGAVRTLLEQLVVHLRAAAEGGGGNLMSLAQLGPEACGVIADVLGTGEVEVRIGGDPAYAVEETALAGLWRGQARDADGNAIAEWLEVADVPAVVREAVARHTVAALPRPALLPAGCMNVLPLLHELQERMADWQPGDGNHVMSLSLFPLTSEDAAVLTHSLGQAPVEMRSKGYGSCRIVPTRRRHVWGVQYFNVMGTVILDTLEVGDVPASALAGREDFEDSAERLGEILDACFAGSEL